MPRSLRFLQAVKPPLGRKNAWRLALGAVLAFATATASANVIVNFQFQDVVFRSGAVATGTFTLDETRRSTTAVDILYSGNPLQPSFHFTDATVDGTACAESPNNLGVAFCNRGNTFVILGFSFADPLGTGADTITARGSSFSNLNSDFIDDPVISGSIVPAATAGVPEPGSLALLGLGIAAIAVARRKSTR